MVSPLSGLKYFFDFNPGLHSVTGSLITAWADLFRVYNPVPLGFTFEKVRRLKVWKRSAQAEERESVTECRPG